MSLKEIKLNKNDITIQQMKRFIEMMFINLPIAKETNETRGTNKYILINDTTFINSEIKYPNGTTLFKMNFEKDGVKNALAFDLNKLIVVKDNIKENYTLEEKYSADKTLINDEEYTEKLFSFTKDFLEFYKEESPNTFKGFMKNLKNSFSEEGEVKNIFNILSDELKNEKNSISKEISDIVKTTTNSIEIINQKENKKPTKDKNTPDINDSLINMGIGVVDK